MNNFYLKYLKYKKKYLNVKYYGGAKGKKKATSVAKESETVEEHVEPIADLTSAPILTPSKAAHSMLGEDASPFLTPSDSFIKTPTPSKTIPSTLADRGTPPSNIESNTLDRLIENKDKLFCLLSANPDLSSYKITTRNTKGIKSQLYINFEKNKKDFAHFSFHYPDDEPNKRFGDEFEASTFHLKLDQFKYDIVFNLDEKDLKLKSKLDDCQLEAIIGKNNLIEAKKIIACFEEIFSNDTYKKILGNATAKQLNFDT